MKATFAQHCGIANKQRIEQTAQLAQTIEGKGIELIRFAWCDLHGMLRTKTLMAGAALRAIDSGVSMVSTLLLKDSSDRTAYEIFGESSAVALPGFEFASNAMLLADPGSFRELPWLEKTGWLQCQPWFQNGQPIAFDTRRVLQSALAKLSDSGFGMVCGLEVEFHIYKLDAGAQALQFDPHQASWPGKPPSVSMIHPGCHMLSEQWLDMADEPLRIVQRTAQALGLPLLSLEIEMGPSQVEAVFDATDALTAADNMVLFRSSVKQALRRAGYHATFVCRPPFDCIMSSGWHLHQSLVDSRTSQNLFKRSAPALDAKPGEAQYTLSEVGEYYLAGLLQHAHGVTALSTPTINAYERFGPNALAPQSVVWGRDNRGAMLRVIGECGDDATRIENRIGEPAANPYLYIASQIHAGLDGIERKLRAPEATRAPYGAAAQRLPSTLGDAVSALCDDAALIAGFGSDFVRYFTQVKRAEISRHDEAEDKHQWQSREYFSRI